MSDAEDSVQLPVPHVIQQTQWDCGLACSQMALKYGLGDAFSADHFTTICKELNFGESVWTIDIAHIVTRHGLKHLLCTQTLGVDSGYKKEDFYEDTFNEDEKRVNALFKNAASLGIHTQKRSVSISEIHRHLSQEQVAVVLTNSELLDCKLCPEEERDTSQQGGKLSGILSLTCCRSVPYTGHFIVVCGYDRRDGTVYYKNPACYSDLCCCSVKDFNRARKSYGTDEDILFIYR
ncbi:protein GUCD1-like [Ptychodera flava]|uniref:protein GUCD1-like n=1 Tax=Ptychodera flava TaxID=63121 RepID=UPI00396A2119